jgi:hypothetical protein
VGIRYRQEFEFVCSLNLPPKVPEFRYPIAEIQHPPPESGLKFDGAWPPLPESGCIVPNSSQFGQNLAICVGFQSLSRESG